jgi:radical SAM protein with 4Fe4S-binding SPASM domain
VIEANSSCNLACVSCNRSELVEKNLRTKKNLSREELKLILNKFLKCPIQTVKFEWLSEPMLHAEFDVLLSDVRSAFPKAKIIIATNLQYDVNKSPLLKSIEIADLVYLSIDGVGKNYEKIRVGANYDKLLKSLKTITESVGKFDRTTKLFINFTLSKENITDLPIIYELNNSYELAGVRINYAQNWSQNKSTLTDFSNEEIAIVQNYVKDLQGVGGWDYKDCFWPFHGITLDVFGNIRQCIIKTDQTPLGNVFSDDVESIFNSHVYYEESRKNILNNISPHGCEKCSYKELSGLLWKTFNGKGREPHAIVSAKDQGGRYE